MRKHITQAEILRVEKLLRSGVTEPAEIQTEVFVHAECIQQVIDKFNKQSESTPTAPKRRRKKAVSVDPLS